MIQILYRYATCEGYGLCVLFWKFDVLTLEYMHVGMVQTFWGIRHLLTSYFRVSFGQDFDLTRRVFMCALFLLFPFSLPRFHHPETVSFLLPTL